jgi:hypothetical protein
MFGRHAVRSLLVLGLLAVSVAGCAGGASSIGPVATPGAVIVRTSADALGRVVALEPRLAGIQAFDSGLIGQSSWYTVEPASGVGAFVVTVQVGWGDCESGCIEEHGWVFAVAPNGEVSVLSDTGAPVPGDAWPSPAGAGKTGIEGIALAGPVCPVETVPPDPACAPRPVEGAEVVIRDRAGSELVRVVTAAGGTFFAALPVGEYVVEPQRVDGLMGTADAVEVIVGDGGAVHVQLDYDTGIR